MKKLILTIMIMFICTGCKTIEYKPIDINNLDKYEVFTQTVHIGTLKNEPFDVTRDRRLEELTYAAGKYYIYYKGKILIDIVDNKSQFNRNIVVRKSLIKRDTV